MDAPDAGAAANDQPRQNGAMAGLAGPSPSAPAPMPEPELAEANQEEDEQRQRWRRRFTIATVLVTLIVAALVLPPLVNIGRYKHQITALMSRSLGRPVHMSSVGLRLLPMPGFVLQDLSVGEDPHYGAEPVLSAATVLARVNLFSLWRGRLEISRISVDEASLNLVRAPDGRWNIDSLMLSAQPALTGHAGAGKPVSRPDRHFPYLEATDSRVNIKYGDEKKPYALTGTDLSLWQDSPGLWRFRLKGLPVRTDIPMSAADAGELRVEGSLHSAPTLRDMPLSLQIEWREAQLGQLSRLLLGSDAGWRGDVTADIEVHGTAENAQTRSRLRVVGIRREEFTPQTSLNFEANCTLRYQHSLNAVHDLACDTDSGGGQIHLRADLPGAAGPPHGTLEVHDVPLQGGLDLLRAVRSGFAPGLSIAGNINGSLAYVQPEESVPAPAPTLAVRQSRSARSGNAPITPPAPALRGELVMDGARLEGDALKEPLILPRMVWAPAASQSAASQPGADRTIPSDPAALALTARFVVPIGSGKAAALPSAAPPAVAPKTASSAATPAASVELPTRAEAQALTVEVTLGQNGYQAQIDGAGSIARLRELAYALGTPELDAVDALSGYADELSLRAVGPWLPSTDIGVESPAPPPTPTPKAQLSRPSRRVKTSLAPATLPQLPSIPVSGKDSFTGTILLRRALWSPGFLASPVTFTQASVQLSSANLAFASSFTFGGALEPAKEAEPNQPRQTEPRKTDAKTTPSPNTRANSAPEPPSSSSTVRGTVTLTSPIVCAATCRPQVHLYFTSLNAAELQSALLNTPRSQGFFAPLLDRMRSTQPASLPDFDAELDAASLTLGPLTFPFKAKFHPQHGDFLIDNWTAALFGGSAQGTGQVTLTNGKPAYAIEGSLEQANGSQLAAFTGLHASSGTVSASGQIQLAGLKAKDLAASATGQIRFDWHAGVIQIPNQPTLSRFDDWSGTATLASGHAELGANTLVHGKQTVTVSGSLPFAEPAKLSAEPSPVKTGQK